MTTLAQILVILLTIYSLGLSARKSRLEGNKDICPIINVVNLTNDSAKSDKRYEEGLNKIPYIKVNTRLSEFPLLSQFIHLSSALINQTVEIA